MGAHRRRCHIQPFRVGVLGGQWGWRGRTREADGESPYSPERMSENRLPGSKAWEPSFPKDLDRFAQ